MNFKKTKIWVLLSTLSLIMLFGSMGCTDAPNFSETPFIEFIGMSKDTMLQGLNEQDSLVVFIHFEDGDGDIGNDPMSGSNNVFVIDERIGIQDNSFRIPTIPEEGAANGIEGTIKLVFFSTCCIFDDSGVDPCLIDPDQPFDEVQYRIYMEDRAGNKSNEILTTPITLLCQ